VRSFAATSKGTAAQVGGDPAVIAMTLSQESFTPILRRALLTGILLDLGLIGARVLLYPPVLKEPDSLTYVIEPVAILLGYAGIVAAVTTGSNPGRAKALAVGSAAGLLTGAMWIVNLTVETFADLSAGTSLLASAPLLLGAFAVWGAAGVYTAYRTSSLPLGILATVVGSLLCVVITITFGLALAFTSLPRLAHNVAADPDYLRSGWGDVTAFAIANQFSAAASHLLIAPLVAATVGLLSGLLAQGLGRLAAPGAE
jgi:hypothetical protein